MNKFYVKLTNGAIGYTYEDNLAIGDFICMIVFNLSGNFETKNGKVETIIK